MSISHGQTLLACKCILPLITREDTSRRNDPRSSFFVPALSTNLSTVPCRFATLPISAEIHRQPALHWTSPTSANRSLSTIEPVCGTPKWKLENGAQRPAPEIRPARIEKPKIAGQRLGRASLTRGNVADSHTPGNKTSETRLPGWGGRIRTSAWRNQNPLPYSETFFHPGLCTLLEVFFLNRTILSKP